jgi:hypothetical protein
MRISGSKRLVSGRAGGVVVAGGGVIGGDTADASGDALAEAELEFACLDAANGPMVPTVRVGEGVGGPDEPDEPPHAVNDVTRAHPVDRVMKLATTNF